MSGTVLPKFGPQRPFGNYGSDGNVRVDGSPHQQGLLRFTISGITGVITTAKLRLFVTNPTSNGPKAFKAESDWTEQTVNWTTRPALIGAAIADHGGIPTTGWIELDVTAAATRNGDVTVALLPDTFRRVRSGVAGEHGSFASTEVGGDVRFR